jgi:hypothetical protein
MTVGTGERSWHFKQLRWSLQNLAASASDQRPLFPDGSATADALAQDYDHWATVIRETYGRELNDAQRTSLDGIGQVFARMSRDGSEFDAEVWTEAAVKTSEHWASVRRLTIDALHAFGWVAEDSPADPADRGEGSVASVPPAATGRPAGIAADREEDASREDDASSSARGRGSH